MTFALRNSEIVLASLLWATRAMVMEMAFLGALRSRMTTALALELSSGREKSKKTETEMEMETETETETEKEPVPSHYCCWRKSLGQGRETKKTGTMKEPVPAHCCCCWRRKSLDSGMVQKRNLATGMETIPSSSLG